MLDTGYWLGELIGLIGLIELIGLIGLIELIGLIDRTVFPIRNPHSEIRNREAGHWMPAANECLAQGVRNKINV